MLIYVSKTKVLRRRIEDKVFYFMLIGVMIACIFEVFSYSIDGRVFPGAVFLNYVLNTYLYVVNTLLSFCILVYFDLVLYRDLSRIRKHYKPQIIVELLMLASVAVNFFVPITFSISEDNVYTRHPFSYVYLAVIVYYTASAWLTTRRYEKEVKVHAFLNVNMFLAPVILGAALQFLFYGLSLGWLASAVGLVCLYMMQQNETAYIDPVSDIGNRQYMNFLLSSWTKSGCSIAGMMIDVDRFKYINDNFGHAEGDVVIKTFASLLMQARCGGEMVFRFAGDEFIVLKKTDAPAGLDLYIDRMTRLIGEFNASSGKAYALSISYGTSFYDPQAPDFNGFMKTMDDRMYEMKAVHHGETLQSAGADR